MPILLLAYLAFISMALPDGLLGVAWASMRLTFDEPVSALGLLLPFAVISSLLSSAAAGFVLARIGVGRLLAASTALSAAALVGYSLASAFWVIIAATTLLAAGSGAVDSGLNAYAARHFGARHINWMHASYGLGATVGPLLVTGMIGAGLSWRWAYASVAATQVLLAIAFAGTSRAWIARDTADRRVPSTSVRTDGSPWHTLRLAAVWRGASLFALQSGLEASTALWAFLFLTGGRGLAAAPAAATVSAYWAALCVGRLVLGPLAERYGSRPVLVVGVTGIGLGAVLVVLPAPAGVAVAGFVLIGLAAAPMFPLLTLTTRERVGATHADRAVGVQVAASSVAAATIPATIGVLIDHLGTLVLGPCLLALAAATAGVYATLAGRPVTSTRTDAPSS